MPRKNTCLVCSSKKKKKIYHINSYDMVRCAKCSFCFVHPFPSTKSLNKFYSKTFSYSSGFANEKKIRNEARRVLDKTRKYKKGQGLRLLDIGSGAGFFLDEAQKQDFAAFGVEPSKKLSKFASKQYGLTIYNQSFEKVALPKKSFDVVTMHQLVEHLIDPHSFMKKIHKLLVPGGLLYLVTPNIESVLHRVFKENFHYLIPPEHVAFYSTLTLKKLVEKNRLTPLYTGTYGYSVDLAEIIKKLVKKDSNKVSKKNTTVLDREEKLSPIKRVKYLLFDQVFCRLFHPFLNINQSGSMVELIAINKL